MQGDDGAAAPIIYPLLLLPKETSAAQDVGELKKCSGFQLVPSPIYPIYDVSNRSNI